MKPDLGPSSEPFNDLSLTHLDINGVFENLPRKKNNNWGSGS